MEQLTPSQLVKKQQMEASGELFVPPSEYKKQRISKAPKGQKKRTDASGQSVYRHQGDHVFKSNSWAKPVYRQLAPESQDLVQMILDPETCMTPVRWPNTLGPSAVFKTKNVMDAKFDAEGKSIVVVGPSLSNGIFTTAGAVEGDIIFDRIDLTNSLYGEGTLVSSAVVDFDAGVDYYWVTPISQAVGNHVVIPRPTTKSDLDETSGNIIVGTGNMVYPIQIDLDATTNLGVKIAGSFNTEAISCEVSFYDANLDPTAHYVMYPSTVGIMQASAITFSSCRYISIVFTARAAYRGQLQIAIGLIGGSNPTTYRFNNVAEHGVVTGISNGSTIINNAWQYFMVAQSLLLTYEGSTLENSGQLAIARVSGDSILGLSNYRDVQYDSYYQAIADLPINNYNGRTSKGGYCWYLGDDEESYFYRPIGDDSFNQESYMIAAFSSNDTSGTPVRIMINSVVQFTTDNTAFELRPSCYIGQDMEHIRFLLSNIRAAYENPTHREQLTRFLKDVGSRLLGVLKNPSTYTTAAQLATLLL